MSTIATGNNTPTRGDDFAKPTPEEQKTLDTLYAPIRPQTEMFPVAVALRPVFEASDASLAETLGLTTEQRATEQKEFTQAIQESDLDPYVVGQRIYTHLVKARVAEARGRGDEGKLARTIQEGNETIRRELRSTYGPKETDDLIARAQRFTKQFPKLHAILGTAAIGSRPDVVIPIIEHVRRVNFR